MERVHLPGRVRPRIGWIMAGLAFVPLAGLILFAAGEVRTVSAQRTETQGVVASTERTVALVQLSSAIADEKQWTHARNGLHDLGVDPAAMAEVVGIDVTNEHELATVEVDRWLAELDNHDFGDRIRALRSDDSLSTIEVTLAFEPIELDVERQLRDEIDLLVRSAATLPDGDHLVDAARALEVAAEVRRDIAWQLGSFFGTRFEVGRSPEDSVRLLVAQFGQYVGHLEELDRLAPDGSRIAAALPALRADPNVRRFTSEIDRQIDRAMRGRVPGGAVDLSAEVENPAAIAATFTTAVRATDAHLPLVTAAADDITQQAAAVRADADRQLQYAASFWAAVTLASALAALLATRVIVTPLRKLSDAAATLRAGSLDVHVDKRGPREIQTAARAMNEAIDQLKLVELQAMALADGDVDHPVLETETPGRLGSSLRRAVSHLTESLTEREEFRRRLAHEAAHDGLTGLANRRAAIAHLSQALARTRRAGATVAVLFVDLDGFKAVNDLHGHPVGDRVLTKIAQLLATTIREGDMAGRLGGDEFIVVAEPVADEADATALAMRITEALSRPLTAGDITITPHCSIGVALPTDDQPSAEQLVHDADLAVYEAKRRGRSEIVVCTDALRDQVAQRGAVERGLRAAIDNDHLELYFQTIVDARTLDPVGLEALVRWHHPDQGMIMPDVFIAVAERSDLILALDRWVLDRASEHLAAWATVDGLDQLSLAVNLSSRHLGQPDLADTVLGALRAHAVDPARLIIEVTESALLDDLDAAAAQLGELRAAGVRIAIDDFGTGYTSLTHLRSLPVDILKIDRSYTASLGTEADATLLRLIIDSGHLLGLEVIAEGIETSGQVDHLSGLGADTLQGYHFCRPMPALQLVEWLGNLPEQPSESDGPVELRPAVG